MCSRKTQLASRRIPSGIYRRKALPEEVSELKRLATEENKLYVSASTDLKSTIQAREETSGGAVLLCFFLCDVRSERWVLCL